MYGTQTLTGMANPYLMTGLSPVPQSPPPGGVPPAGVASAIATDPYGGVPPLWSPDNPMLWIGVLIAAMTGFIGLAGAVKVGPIKGSASIGGA